MSELIQTIETFYINNTEISIAIISALIIAILIKPKQIGKILGAVAIMAIIAYVFVSLSDTASKGINNKNEASTRADKDYRDSKL